MARGMNMVCDDEDSAPFMGIALAHSQKVPPKESAKRFGDVERAAPRSYTCTVGNKKL
jgi:hypothetical protein